MPDLEDTVGGDAAMDPSAVSDRTFATAFRGFDPVQVRSFLGDVADELRRLHEREAELRAALEGGSTAAAEAERAPDLASAEVVVADAEAEAAAIVEAARAEADRLLREAKERVATLGSAATSETARVLEEARAEAARLRATATDALKGRAEEAEATAVRKIAEAEREAAAIRVRAREEADAVIEAARDRGREMVAEAQAARERMLADLAKRKRAAQAQLEQLRAGRDRLLDTLKVARRSIDEMTTRFDASDGGAAGSLTPPSSGTPAGSVTTTPGATNTEARPRIAASAAAPGTGGATPAAEPAPRPVRTRAVALGEAPPQAARPQIAAPQAQSVVEAAPAPEAPATPVPEVPSVQAASAAPVVTAPEAVVPAPPTEERRSSALRILRRNKAPDPVAAPPPPIGRESHGEGVRIIGRPAAAPAEVAAPRADVPAVEAPPTGSPPPPAREAPIEPEVLAPSATSVEEPAADEEETATDPVVLDELDELDEEPEPEPEPAAAPTVEAATAFRATVEDEPVESVAASVEEPTAAVAEGAPLLQEEIRPRIEDLFARIRADREATTASARQVLGIDEPSGAASPAARGAAAGADGEAREPATSSVAVAEEDERMGVAAVTDADENRLQQRDALVDPLAAQLTKRLKRALQDEQNASLDRLRTSRGRAQVDQVLSRPDDQATPYRHLALPFLEQAGRGGAAASPFGPVSVAVEDLAAQLAEDLAGALRSRLDTVLSTGASEEVDLATLSERISAVYREWKVSKVERLGVHYLVAAHERGGFLAHPEGTPLRWLVDDDGPCPDCEDNALAGPTPRGQAFPTGQLHPPAHLGCRCLLVATPT